MRKMKDTVTFLRMESLEESKMKIRSFSPSSLKYQGYSLFIENHPRGMLIQIGLI